MKRREGAIHHIALRVKDPVVSAAFYSSLLDLSEVRRISGDGGVRSIWLRAGDSLLMLETALRGAGETSGSGHLLAFAAEDLEAWEKRLVRAGIAVLDRTPHSLYFADPDNHRVGVSVYREDR
jgi:catechol 2,3-dioxygenase-like lactoylglutathione lyase family enzyme